MGAQNQTGSDGKPVRPIFASDAQYNMKTNSGNQEYWNENLSTYNLMNSDAYRQGIAGINQLAQGFAYDPSGEAAMTQQAQRQAQQNVRGVGNIYGNVGAANSGAAQAAAAEGAANPYYATQVAINQQKQDARGRQAAFAGQATMGLMDQFLGVQKSASGAEKDITRQKMGSQ